MNDARKQATDLLYRTIVQNPYKIDADGVIMAELEKPSIDDCTAEINWLIEQERANLESYKAGLERVKKDFSVFWPERQRRTTEAQALVDKIQARLDAYHLVLFYFKRDLLPRTQIAEAVKEGEQK